MSGWSDGAYWLEPLTIAGEETPEFTRFRTVAETAPKQLRVAGVQIGLYRVISHWQRRAHDVTR